MTDHARRNRAAALLSVASNALLTAVKLAIGLVTGSVAVLSEAANSAGDLIASAIAFAGVRAAARPADADHPYGHEKSENLAAAIEGVLVLAAGAAVAAEAVRRLVSGCAGDRLSRPGRRRHGGLGGRQPASWRCGCGGWPGGRAPRRSRATPPTWRPTSGPPAATAAGLALVALTGWTALDAIVALAVAGYVMSVGLRLAWRAGHVLLDGSLPESEIEVIEDVLAGFERDGVSFHALRGRRAGAKRLVDLHMVVPPDTTVRRGHAMSGRVKGAVRTALPGTEVLIHLEDH